MKLKIYTTLDRRPGEGSSPGNPIVPIYEERITKDGKTGLHKTGEDNLKDKIIMQAESCDIKKILEKYKKTGDINLLEKTKTFYADVTNIPKNIIEAQNKIKEIESYFNNLPAEIKAKFSNNQYEFINAIMNNTVDKIANTEANIEKTENNNTEKTENEENK